MGYCGIDSSRAFAGQSIIVTGANSGLGLEAAVHYVKNGAQNVYVTARNEVRAAAAKLEIEKRTGTEGRGVVKARVLDMDTFEGVKRFVEGPKKDVKSIGEGYILNTFKSLELT
jgi:NAD(P)-dependent dehydrogenase (short-subunit alcohol dehydrogenase family)